MCYADFQCQEPRYQGLHESPCVGHSSMKKNLQKLSATIGGVILTRISQTMCLDALLVLLRTSMRERVCYLIMLQPFAHPK